jgi:AcrR family transcriptional regulator
MVGDVSDARARMVDAAERIGATEGFGALTLRQVQLASGQRNKSAAQYHFGSREGLIEAVLTARMGPVNERRKELLADLDDDAPLRDVVAALVVPLAEVALAPGSHWARFLFHGWADPQVREVVQQALEAASYRRVRELLVERLADLPDPVRRRRIDQLVGLIVLSLAAVEHGSGRWRLPVDAQLADLLDAGCGLLAAPVTADTATHLTTMTGGQR